MMTTTWLLTVTEVNDVPPLRQRVHSLVSNAERGLRQICRPVLTQLLRWLEATENCAPDQRWELRPLGTLLPKGARPVHVLSDTGEVLASADGQCPTVPTDVLDQMRAHAPSGREHTVHVSAPDRAPLELHFPAKHVVFTGRQPYPRGDNELLHLADRITMELADGTTVTFKDRHGRP